MSLCYDTNKKPPKIPKITKYNCFHLPSKLQNYILLFAARTTVLLFHVKTTPCRVLLEWPSTLSLGLFVFSESCANDATRVTGGTGEILHIANTAVKSLSALEGPQFL